VFLHGISPVKDAAAKLLVGIRSECANHCPMNLISRRVNC
jgi:hypothetical protein